MAILIMAMTLWCVKSKSIELLLRRTCPVALSVSPPHPDSRDISIFVDNASQFGDNTPVLVRCEFGISPENPEAVPLSWLFLRLCTWILEIMAKEHFQHFICCS